MFQYWLMKSEPESYSIDDLKRDGFSSWEGVRNYQARNFMRDVMKPGDLALFYHSNAKPPGIAGICRVCSTPFPDKTALDSNSPYYDKRARPDNPIWMMVEVEFVEKFSHFVSLPDIKDIPDLNDMVLLTKSRLSIQPITKQHFEIIRELGRQKTHADTTVSTHTQTPTKKPNT